MTKPNVVTEDLEVQEKIRTMNLERYSPLKAQKEVSKEDIDHMKEIVRKVDNKEVPEGWFESMDTIKWINDTTILVGTYGFLSDREWEFDMVNDVYKLTMFS